MDIRQIARSLEYGHSKQVAKISEILARNAGYSPSEVSIISQAAAFHDIGKSAVPAEILNKPAALTPEEFEIVKTHTRIGYEQLSDAAQVLSLAATLAREHHEHVDGRGGYHNISGADVNPIARIVAVSDVYDALRSRRSYKSSWGLGDICAYFGSLAGTQFDPAAVQVLLSSIREIQQLYDNEESRG